eukprot:gnl/TRDRNA2_/TRDRNA2_85325_c0_seq1.p1 gnl/TRDRNA2_/TRDRNA2_85325_c0~~gnl/TRDRNA2_/TRDRNA2_85325_c0_seq1.p1  ORF type:complete len:494 (+),score=87.47 gnl/TRDRNA2_/TRDRNA2_85325_c0_seq1:98-1483(+)
MVQAASEQVAPTMDNAGWQPKADLDLPEKEFTYMAGSTDRPWSQFTGRWKAMKPRLAQLLKDAAVAAGAGQPLRIIDLGACTGFFSIQTAWQHPEVDIIAVEGAVGIGNGSVGMGGSTKQILNTYAIQTYTKWARKAQLQNCYVVPEVWDYFRVCELCESGRPICDVMFSLSVIHHIDGVSVQQYTHAGHTRVQGTIDLIARLLLLAPVHFIELPDKPWLAAAYEAYGTQRRILEEAAKASKMQWAFIGPIHEADWFGHRDLWIMKAQGPMPDLDRQQIPFPAIFHSDDQEPPAPSKEQEHVQTSSVRARDSGVRERYYQQQNGRRSDRPDNMPLGYGASDPGRRAPTAAATAGSLHSDQALSAGGMGSLLDGDLPFSYGHIHNGVLVGPVLEPCEPVSDAFGEVLSVAPTSLLIAHLTLREAIDEAQDVLHQIQSTHGRRAPAAAAPAPQRGMESTAVRR